jgi:hypothetical protein
LQLEEALERCEHLDRVVFQALLVVVVVLLVVVVPCLLITNLRCRGVLLLDVILRGVLLGSIPAV